MVEFVLELGAKTCFVDGVCWERFHFGLKLWVEMLVKGREEFWKVSNQKCIVSGLSGPIVLVVFFHHVLHVMLAAFLGKLGDV